jgi:hypothetical protein
MEMHRPYDMVCHEDIMQPPNMIEDLINEGVEEEEEECDDEDCEYCRQYYLQQMQLQQ